MPDTYQRRPETELALSGGGFRATLFHIGGLWRLSEKLIEDFLPGAAKGTYWGINTRIADYELEAQNLGTPMVADNDATRSSSDMRTRLNKVLPREQGQLINWGCGLTDAAMRRFVLPHSAPAAHRPDTGRT